MCRRQHRRFCEDSGDSIAAGQGALGRCERSGQERWGDASGEDVAWHGNEGRG